jgi:hypothetical protein
LRKRYTEPSIAASYQISVHLAIQFQRRRFFRNNQKKELPMVAMFVNRSGRNEQSPQAVLVSDWSISKKSSPLKPLGQMNRNLVGNIYGSSSINIAHFVLIR